MPGHVTSGVVDLAAAVAKAVPGAIVSSEEPDRVAYARDLWPRRLIELRGGRGTEHKPAVVAWPRNVDEVAAIVGFARSEGISVVPFGAGSGVCGGILPDSNTLVLDLKRLDDWSIDADAPLIDVGAGAMGITLEKEIQRQGFTIGHFPSSILCSTVGGWVAARGAGQCSGLYGKIEDMVVSLECVLGTGEVVEMRRRRSGPDMIPLVVGSEGTLGVVTRAKLRLHPDPSARAHLAFDFPDVPAGFDAMRRLFQEGLRPAVSRLYDPIDSMMMRQGAVKPEAAPRAARPKSGKSKPSRAKALAGVLRTALKAPTAINAAIEAAEGNLLGGATLVLIFEGQSEHAHADAERARSLCARAGGTDLGEGPAHAWFRHRYSVSYRQSPVFRMGAFSDTMEVAAPWSRLGDLYDDVRRALGEHVVVMAHLSHAYPDGCSIYFTFSGACNTDAEAEALYDRAWRDALTAAIGAGGTLSHHHGVGRSKAPRLGEELGLGIEVVRRLMHAWDPEGIMNPGNLAPRETFESPSAPGVPMGRTPWVSPGRKEAPASIDETSLLAEFAGGTTLESAESLLGDRGLTLALEPTIAKSTTVAQWIAGGCPGSRDPFSDPVDHVLAGLSARLRSDEVLEIRPAPRRAVGPDLSALFAGADEAVGRVEHASLRVYPRGAPPARSLSFEWERDPPLSAGESQAWQQIVRRVAQR